MFRVCFDLPNLLKLTHLAHMQSLNVVSPDMFSLETTLIKAWNNYPCISFFLLRTRAVMLFEPKCMLKNLYFYHHLAMISVDRNTKQE